MSELITFSPCQLFLVAGCSVAIELETKKQFTFIVHEFINKMEPDRNIVGIRGMDINKHVIVKSLDNINLKKSIVV